MLIIKKKLKIYTWEIQRRITLEDLIVNNFSPYGLPLIPPKILESYSNYTDYKENLTEEENNQLNNNPDIANPEDNMDQKFGLLHDNGENT